jgi:hypothetical protein
MTNTQFHDCFEKPLRERNMNDVALSKARLMLMLNKREPQLKKELQLVDEVEEDPVEQPFEIYISPDSKFAERWSIVMILCLLYVATVMPFTLSFIDEPQLILRICERVVDVMFILDIIVNLLSAYKEDNVLVTNNKKIASNYMHGWFIFDFIASFPTKEVLDAVTIKNSQNMDLTKLVKLPRLSRLSRLARLVKIISFIKKNAQLNKLKEQLNINNATLRLSQFLMLSIVIVHFVACMWYFSSKIYDFNEETWVNRKGYLERSTWSKYIFSFYWSIQTVLTVGYGDIPAVTTLE